MVEGAAGGDDPLQSVSTVLCLSVTGSPSGSDHALLRVSCHAAAVLSIACDLEALGGTAWPENEPTVADLASDLWQSAVQNGPRQKSDVPITDFWRVFGRCRSAPTVVRSAGVRTR